MNWLEIHGKTAYELLELVGIKEPPFSPIEIVEKLNEKGFRIAVSMEIDMENIDKRNFGQISVVNGLPSIWINPLTSETEQRFTLAHELGHLVNDLSQNLENPIVDTYETLYRSFVLTPKETLANKFAEQLLMPLFALENFIESTREAFRKEGKELSAKEAILLVAVKFKVSKEAVFYRLKNVGYVARSYKYPF